MADKGKHKPKGGVREKGRKDPGFWSKFFQGGVADEVDRQQDTKKRINRALPPAPKKKKRKKVK